MVYWFKNTSTKQKRILLFFFIIFLISAGLRTGMVRFNRQSNDLHMEVIKSILLTNQLPEKPDCFECFQPKLFHYTAAMFLRLTGMENLNDRGVIFGAELVDYVAGLITIIIIGLFLYRLPVKYDVLKILAYGLVALNPKLIGINSQATNDTFAILFSTLALFCTFLYLKKSKPITFIFIVLFTILAISSKTNCWVTAIAIFISLLINIWMDKERRWKSIYIPFTFALATVILSILNPLNQYIVNTQKYGSPILMNLDVQPTPDFIIQSPTSYPGVLSIEDGYFTFKFYDLLVYPRIENGYGGYPPHRTSLWTQLYGRAYSVHFDNWPKDWSTSGEDGFPLSRAIFSLALLPTILLLVGFVMESFLTIKAFFKQDAILASDSHFGLAGVAFIGYILFVIFYTLEYREYQTMKAIFIYPAIITFPLFFLRSGDAIFDRISKRFNWIKICIVAMIVVLLILFCTDIITMIRLIYTNTFSQMA
jgi:hypothetical protein